MAFLFRACRRSDPVAGHGHDHDHDDHGHDHDDHAIKPRLPRSVGGYYYYDEDDEDTGAGVCGRRLCLGGRKKGAAPRGRGRSVGRIAHAPVDDAAAEMVNIQPKRSYPSRSPSRKLTPYPGKTGSSSLKNLHKFVTAAPGPLGAMDRDSSDPPSRNPSFRRSNAKKYSIACSSKASSICANSGAKPIKDWERSGSNSNNSSSRGNSNSKSRESRSTNTGSGSGESGESGDTGTSSNTYSSCSYDSIDWSKPPSSLLEASMRRVAINEKREMENRERERIKKLKLYPKPLKVFTESFFKGLLSSNPQWASDPRVEDCFNEEARMMTHDGQMYYGRMGLIKRLNRGMERLLKMLGEHGKGKKNKLGLGANEQLDLKKLQALGLECLEPVQVEEGTWRVVFNMKKGVLKYSFEDEFIMEDGKIKKLTRRLIK